MTNFFWNIVINCPQGRNFQLKNGILLIWNSLGLRVYVFTVHSVVRKPMTTRISGQNPNVLWCNSETVIIQFSHNPQITVILQYTCCTLFYNVPLYDVPNYHLILTCDFSTFFHFSFCFLFHISFTCSSLSLPNDSPAESKHRTPKSKRRTRDNDIIWNKLYNKNI